MNRLPPIHENREGDDIIQRRKILLAKFKKIHLEENEELCREFEENNSDQSRDKSWLNDAQQAQWDSDRFSYAKPYQAEYQLSPTSLNNDEDQDDLDVSDAVSDTFGSIRSVRSRRGRGPSSIKTSVDFDRTSTCMYQPTEVGDEDAKCLSVDELRNTYFKDYKPETGVPIYSQKTYIINSINTYSVVIIEGRTGCGKTTQVPVYVLEDAILGKGIKESPKIYVTQPRRIAARSIAERVCEEHGWEVGSLVGYQVGLDKRCGPDTVLIYCTAGVLLQKLIQEKSLANFSHIFIDEVHERDADTDLLLMMIRTLMRHEPSFFRLVVMSATMDLDKLKNYFTFKKQFGHRSLEYPSVFRVDSKKERQNVQLYCLDNIMATFKFDEVIPPLDIDQPELHEEILKAAVKIVVEIIPALDTFNENTKSTLVFLPGLAEINRMERLLRRAKVLIDVIPLHSSLPTSDQSRVFLPTRPGYRKVILATNIAESSITVKDAGFIIDFCLTKVLKKDEVTKFPTLKLQWCSVDKCTQRAGRTGRCCPGKVFRMVSSRFFRCLERYAEPELLTAPLELSVLRVKNFAMGEIKALLAVVLDPPSIHDIRTAVLELKQIGALSSTFEGKLCDLDGDLTELGKVIASLPIDVHLSKLIVIAHVLDVLQDAIIVAACLSTNRTVVKNCFGNQFRTYANKLKWANGSFSDLFVSLDVFKEFIQYKEQQKSDAWLEAFCYNNDLDEKKLQEVAALYEELVIRLEAINIKLIQLPNIERNTAEDAFMLKVAFCASFYPNYFLSRDFDVDSVSRELRGFDPAKTVLVHSLPAGQVPLYRGQILDQLEGPLTNNIEYAVDYSRAVLLIDSGNVISNHRGDSAALGLEQVIRRSQGVDKAVYLALKIADTDRILIREYHPEPALERMKYYDEKRECLEAEAVAMNRLLPPWTLIVSGRPADNSRFLQSPQSTSYVEVEFNERQDAIDRDQLFKIEEQEQERLQIVSSKPAAPPPPIDHPVFQNTCKALVGPTSPIRLDFVSVLSRSSGYNVDLDSQSVNSVLLEPNYAESSRQMLVAASVSQNRRGRILARDTTLMPNIRGLPTLMALLFAQYYRVIYNEQMKCIAGAIFGLGWDENDESLDENYEVELAFDVHITMDDLFLINKARRIISDLLQNNQILDAGAPRVKAQYQLREIILSLIKGRRLPLNEVHIPTIKWEERIYSKEKHNLPMEHLKKLEDGETRPFLPTVRVDRQFQTADLYEAVRDNLRLIENILEGKVDCPLDGVYCLLCGGDLLIMHNHVVKHIYLASHVDRVNEFEFYAKEVLPID